MLIARSTRLIRLVTRKQSICHHFINRTSTRLSSSGPLSSSKTNREWFYISDTGRQIRLSSSTAKKVEQFILPDIGEGINEVVIKEWQVSVGDTVREFDPICEVESDKASVTISSRYDGMVSKIYYEAGAMAKVGKPLVDIETQSAESAPRVDPPAAAAPPKAAATGGAREEGSYQVSTLPSVRRLALENKIDLSKVTATGKGGRVLKEDVLAFMAGSQPAALACAGGNAREAPPSTSVPGGEWSERPLPLKGMQKAMLKTMTESLKIPHFNYSEEIDMTKLVEFNRELKRGAPEGVVSNLAVIIKMLSLALLDYPQLNASLDEKQEKLIEKSYHNVGVAVDTSSGLTVPNIKNVQSLTIRQINAELSRLRELGYASKLSPSDLARGTITLSNIGAIGGVFGVPVIVAPEIVIGALGRTRALPRFNSRGEVEERQIMQVIWSADHRVVDGATLSRFSNLLKSYLEEPARAVLELA